MRIAEGVNWGLHVISAAHLNGTRDTLTSSTSVRKGSLGGSQDRKLDTLGNEDLPSLESKEGR
jgi:hypothetical protein